MELSPSLEGVVVRLTTCCLAGTISVEVEVTVFLTGVFPVLRPSASVSWAPICSLQGLPQVLWKARSASNGLPLVQIPNTWCRSFFMQCPRATSPRRPRCRNRAYRAATAGLNVTADQALIHKCLRTRSFPFRDIRFETDGSGLPSRSTPEDFSSGKTVRPTWA